MEMRIKETFGSEGLVNFYLSIRGSGIRGRVARLKGQTIKTYKNNYSDCIISTGAVGTIGSLNKYVK